MAARDIRSRLVAATAELIDERGPFGVRIDEVAERAGCSRATLYRYVADKDELVREVIVGRASAIADLVTRQTQSISDPSERVAQGMLLFADAVRSEQWYRAFKEHDGGYGNNALVRVGGGLEAMITMVLPLIEKALTDLANAGHLRDDVVAHDATEWLIGIELAILEPFADHTREQRLAMLKRYALYPLIKSS
ncbi:TetR/AcrR family transcriptional regulator [Mycobacterium avium]|uniref:TetR/AcrR family transcriptional regulator n=1 Tax=Mycobacterium avium TaxID=1764 RepID=UPI000CE4EE4E|nr:TetR/AcrR family transcriptional regulator [Mycobacterium avium]